MKTISSTFGKKILIANRGEIAVRIAKAARELGMEVLGLYTDSEPQAYHLQYCHQWLKLKGSSHAETYLNINQILDLAQQQGAHAIHPGYGFLSENALFAQQVLERGLIFVGPHPKAIEAMGDKARSKQLAKQCGVPTVPGSTEAVPTPEAALKIAQEIGFPVLLKAVAGGGGRGMRVCRNSAEIEQYFSVVQREALSSFGNAELLVEKYITNPHHIEVQVLGDRKGNLFHLFERECSIQRRHQKIIEEAPSPFIGQDWQVRENICQSALQLARAVKYDSAGTVEFVMGEDKKFYFLEMNTRIQVEHPITEEITGIDLVANMIKAAFGMPLDISSQDEIMLQGHAIECRLCMEDPLTLLPAPGTIHGLQTRFLPTQSRFDHCLYPGLEVKADFDPMVAKLIVKGVNRPVAIRKMQSMLAELELKSTKNNLSLLTFILSESMFTQGPYTTQYLDLVKNEREQFIKELRWNWEQPQAWQQLLSELLAGNTL